MPLAGRWIGIDGSASSGADLVTLARCHAAVRTITRGILDRGGGVVVSVGPDPRIEDEPETAQVFYWTVLEEVQAFAESRGGPGSRSERPLAKVIGSKKKFDQIEANRRELYSTLLNMGAIEAKSVPAQWNTGAILRAHQAMAGHGIVLLGGGEGVEHLATLYLETGRPVIPLDARIGGSTEDGNGGARLLYDQALAKPHTYTPLQPQKLPGRLQLASLQRHDADPQVAGREVVALLDEMVVPAVTVLRAKNPVLPQHGQVARFYETVLRPFIDRMGYRIVEAEAGTGVDAVMSQALIQCIHRSAIVIADLSGRPEAALVGLGYALGRRIPVLATAMLNTLPPVDAAALPILAWDPDSLSGMEAQLEVAWNKALARPPIIAPTAF